MEQSFVLNEEQKAKLIKQISQITLFVNSYGYGNELEISMQGNYKFDDIFELIINNPDLLQNIKSQDLALLFANIPYKYIEKNHEIINRMLDELAERTNKEEYIFSGPNREREFFGIRANDLDVAFAKSYKERRENFEPYNEKIIKKLLSYEENPKYKELISSARSMEPSIQKMISAHRLCYAIESGLLNDDKTYEGLLSILSTNPHLIRTLDYSILQNNSVEEFGVDFLRHVGSFINLSQRFSFLLNNCPSLCEPLKQILNLGSEEYDNSKYQLTEKLINYLAKDSENLSDKKINNLSILRAAIIDDNYEEDHFNLKTIEYDENPEELVRKYRAKYDVEYGSKAKTMEEKKDYLLGKMFFISYREARKILEGFGENIDKISGISDDTRTFIAQLTNIVNSEDMQMIDGWFNDANMLQFMPEKLLTINEELTIAYSKTFEDELHKTESRIDDLEFDEVLIDGKNVKVRHLSGNFNLLVHSSDTGFKDDKEIVNGSFIASWEKAKQDSSLHLLATTHVNDDFLGIAPVGKNGVYYAFTDVKSNNLRIAGDTDINSHLRSSGYGAEHLRFDTASDLNLHARRVYSEVTIERENAKPSYVLMFDDATEEVKNNSLKAAAEWGIDVVLIDKEMIMRQQTQKLRKLMDDFSKDMSPEHLSEILTLYETNKAGWLLNKDKPNEKDDKDLVASIDNYKYKPIFDEIEKEIFDLIERALNAPNCQMYAVSLMKTIVKEREMYDRANDNNLHFAKTNISYDGGKILTQAVLKVDDALKLTGRSQKK